MGRGNVCTHYECEGVYYLDLDLIQVYDRTQVYDGEEGTERMTRRELDKMGVNDPLAEGWAYDEFESQMNWNFMVEDMVEDMCKKFKSFYPVDKWHKDSRIVAESGLFTLDVTDNEWSAAWALRERRDVDDVGANRTFMRRHYRAYLEAIKAHLVGRWGECVGYGGAWVSGKKYTAEDMAEGAKKSPAAMGFNDASAV